MNFPSKLIVPEKTRLLLMRATPAGARSALYVANSLSADLDGVGPLAIFFVVRPVHNLGMAQHVNECPSERKAHDYDAPGELSPSKYALPAAKILQHHPDQHQVEDAKQDRGYGSSRIHMPSPQDSVSHRSPALKGGSLSAGVCPGQLPGSTDPVVLLPALTSLNVASWQTTPSESV